MKKTIINFIFLSVFAGNLFAFTAEQDSLYFFLRYIKEDSTDISRIMQSKYALKPLETLSNYVLYHFKLEYDSVENRMDWQFGWKDSVFIRKCDEYITHQILCDTNLSLVGPYLTEMFIGAYSRQNRDEEKSLLKCSQTAIEIYHSRESLIIPELYYYNHKDIADRQEMRLLYTIMLKYILIGRYNEVSIKEICPVTAEKLLSIMKDKEGGDTYYRIYRNLIDNYTDKELARLSVEQKNEVIKIITDGFQCGDKKATLVYAFMLITGQFVEKNEELGNKILSNLLTL